MAEEKKTAEVSDPMKKEVAKLQTEIAWLDDLDKNIIEVKDHFSAIVISKENEKEVRDARKKVRDFRYDLQNAEERIKKNLNNGKKHLKEVIEKRIAILKPLEDKFNSIIQEWDDEKNKEKREKEEAENKRKEEILNSIKQFEEDYTAVILSAKTSTDIDSIELLLPEKDTMEFSNLLEEAIDRLTELSLKRKYDLKEKEELNAKIVKLEQEKAELAKKVKEPEIKPEPASKAILDTPAKEEKFVKDLEEISDFVEKLSPDEVKEVSAKLDEVISEPDTKEEKMPILMQYHFPQFDLMIERMEIDGNTNFKPPVLKFWVKNEYIRVDISDMGWTQREALIGWVNGIIEKRKQFII